MSRRKRPAATSAHNVADVLDEIIDMLDESWKDLVRLRTYKAQFELLAEHLQHYDGSMYVQQWYVADLLMGCRRMVDMGEDILSIRRALYVLRGIADHVTADDIAACRNRHGLNRPRPASTADVESELQHLLGGRTEGEPLGVRVVQKDITLINGVAKRVHRLATDSVAHRFDKPLDESARSVTRAEVATLLKDLNDICGRWSGLLRNVMLAEPPDYPLSPAILKALELFDWAEFTAAVDAEVRRLGPRIGSFEGCRGAGADRVPVRLTRPSCDDPPAMGATNTRRCDYCGGPMPADADPRAQRVYVAVHHPRRRRRRPAWCPLVPGVRRSDRPRTGGTARWSAANGWPTDETVDRSRTPVLPSTHATAATRQRVRRHRSRRGRPVGRPVRPAGDAAGGPGVSSPARGGSCCATSTLPSSLARRA